MELWEINYRERGSLNVLVWLAGLHWNQDVVNVRPLTGSPTPEYTHAFQSEAQSLLFTHVGIWAAQVKLWDSLSAAKVSEAPFWPKVRTPEYILAGLNMDEPLIGLWPKRPLVLCLLFQHALITALASRHTSECMGRFLGILCAHKCTDAPLWKVICVFQYSSLCVWLLPWSSGSWSWIISQMVTSDLLKIWPITANFHSLLLLSHCFSQLAVTGTKWRQQEAKQPSLEDVNTPTQTLLSNRAEIHYNEGYIRAPFVN